MSYQGNSPAISYLATPAVQQFNGNGSTTTFTLNRTVATKQSIIVSVDGVVQDAASAYTVPDGVTLTFTAAPSSGTANIFVNFLDLIQPNTCLLYTSPSPRDGLLSRMPSSA